MSFSQNLYNDLMNLVSDVNQETFYYVDQKANERVYRIFNYRLAGFQQFNSQNASNCRGTMFDITDNVPMLVSLPPEKFFNYSEGNVDHVTNVKIISVMDKRDGSLINSYLDANGNVALKSKASLQSEQAIAAMNLLNENQELYNAIYNLEQKGFTVNMEYTSPLNRIVLAYDISELRILNIRNRNTGETIVPPFINEYSELNNFSVRLIEYDNENTKELHDNVINSKNDIEGYVLYLYNTVQNKYYFVKCKTIAYVQKHKMKDSITLPSHLYEAVVYQNTDDLREMFSDDKMALETIERMENLVFPIYNHVSKTVNEFYNQNPNLSRKDYAIKAGNEYNEYHSLLMQIYLTGNYDIEKFMMKNIRRYLPSNFSSYIVED